MYLLVCRISTSWQMNRHWSLVQFENKCIPLFTLHIKICLILFQRVLYLAQNTGLNFIACSEQKGHKWLIIHCHDVQKSLNSYYELYNECNREVNHWKCINIFNKLLHGSDVHCKHPVNSVKKFSSFSLSYLNYLGEEYHSSIQEINLKCSSHDVLGPRDKGYFANKSIFIHLPCRQCILSFFTLLWIRSLATVHKTNNNFTYHHKLHFHTNIQMDVEIFPTSFVKGKENHSQIYAFIQIVHNTSLFLFTSPTLVFRIKFCTLLKKRNLKMISSLQSWCHTYRRDCQTATVHVRKASLIRISYLIWNILCI